MKLQTRRQHGITNENIISELENITTIAQYEQVLVRLAIDRLTNEKNLLFPNTFSTQKEFRNQFHDIQSHH